jgi:hypothetical protein
MEDEDVVGIDDLMYDGSEFRFSGKSGNEHAAEINTALIEAYRRGWRASRDELNQDEMSRD